MSQEPIIPIDEPNNDPPKEPSVVPIDGPPKDPQNSPIVNQESSDSEDEMMWYPSDQHKKFITQVEMYIYISHFLCSWVEKIWEFAVLVTLSLIINNTFLLTAVFALVTNFANFISGPYVENWIANRGRLQLMQISLLANGIASTFCYAILLGFTDFFNDITSIPWSDFRFLLLYPILVILSSISSIANMTSTIAMKNDWVLVLTKTNNSPKLPILNTNIQRITFLCNIFTPLAFGILVTFSKLQTALMVLTVIHVISSGLGVYLIRWLYFENPDLSVKTIPSKTPKINVNEILGLSESEEDEEKKKKFTKKSCRGSNS